MNNKEKFKETFEQIEISKDVLGEIENLEAKRHRKNYVRPVIAFAMMCALILLTGKVVFDYTQIEDTDEFAKGKIFYAAETEEDNYTFIELPRNEVQLKKENVIVNNDELSQEVASFYVDAEGRYCYEMSDGSSSKVLVEVPGHTSILWFHYKTERGGTSRTMIQFEGKLEEQDGRIYLCFNSYEDGRDITEDFKDGVASERIYWELENAFDRVKATLEYRVEGTLDNYTVDVWFVEE